MFFFSRGLRVSIERTGGERVEGVKIFIGGLSMIFAGLSSRSACWLGTGDDLSGRGDGQMSDILNVPVVSIKAAISLLVTGLFG